MQGQSIIGIDLGGTKMAAGRFDAKTFSVQDQKKIPTPRSSGFGEVLDTLIALIIELRTPDTIALGVGVPGLVMHETGVLLRAPNIPGSENIPLRETLERETGLPVTIENDAQCFSYGEAILGAGKGHSVVIGITVGTGVGGGIVINGQLFRGAHGHAAEIGHMLLRPGEPPFETKDKRGEVEQFISGSAMKLRCKEAKSPQDYLEGEVCSFLRPEVFREVGWMCASLTALIDPSIIIFGGSTGLAFGPHLAEIAKEWKLWTLPGSTEPQFAISSLPDSSMRGAASLALAAM